MKVCMWVNRAVLGMNFINIDHQHDLIDGKLGRTFSEEI